MKPTNIISINEYQEVANSTDLTVGKGQGVLSISFMDKILGLVGESGEIADKVKKILRDQDAKMNEADRQELIKELGDVLWYVATIATNLEVNLSEVATMNLEKLKDRQKRGKLAGNGDNR